MSIPLSALINGKANVVAAGSSPISLNGVMITKSTLIPSGIIYPLQNQAQAGDVFGLESTEYDNAGNYFDGFLNATKIPATLFAIRYNDAATPAVLTSASLQDTPIATIAALSPATITMNVNGVSNTSASCNFSAVSTLADVVSVLNTAFTSDGVTFAIENTNLQTISASTSSTGAGQTIGFPTTSTMTTTLGLTQAAGAVITAGAAADTPAGIMTKIIAQTTNWCSFSTCWEPVTNDKLAFAAWVQTQLIRYVYSAWDTDANAIVPNSQTTFAYLSQQAQNEGIHIISGAASTATNEGTTLAALTMAAAFFVMGSIASVDFGAANGRVDFSYISQAGMKATVDDLTDFNTLEANGYNSYGNFTNGNTTDNNLQRGDINGTWLWLDSYINNVYMRSLMQTDLYTWRKGQKSVPYNSRGYSGIRNVLVADCNQMINFGAIVPGTVLDAAQILAINTAANDSTAASAVATTGYFIQILDPGAEVRAARGSPIINIWYADGGSIQRISFTTWEVQ